MIEVYINNIKYKEFTTYAEAKIYLLANGWAEVLRGGIVIYDSRVEIKEKELMRC